VRELDPIELGNASFLTANDVPYALVEITATQLTKSILDATDLFREFVAAYGIHDYERQVWGTDKLLVPSVLIGLGNKTYDSRASLYRANGRGDTRLWFTSLANVVGPGELIAVIWANQKFWVINASSSSLKSRSLGEPAVQALLEQFVEAKSSAVDELRKLIQSVAAKGFIRAPVIGSTAVGRLLESELGIPMNSRNEPDYKGIEIKSSRAGKNRVSLFAKTPLWSESRYKSSKELLDRFGYARDDRQKLYCQIDGHKTNSQGLRLRVDESKDSLHVIHEKSAELNVAKWELETLRFSLANKHDETFWVKAETRMVDGWEYLRFIGIEHTRKPILAQLGPSLANGTVSLDFTISTKDGKYHDKGYLFKLLPTSLDKLFPPSTRYSLEVSSSISEAR